MYASVDRPLATARECGQRSVGRATDLDQTLGDHPVLRRTQHCVGGLVTGHLDLGLGLLQTSEPGPVEVLGVVVLGAADHLPVDQALIAIALGTDQRQVGLGRCQLGTARIQLQAHVLRVQLSQWLVGLLLHQALAHLAGNTKRQRRFEAGAHFSGVAVGSGNGRLGLNHQRRTRGDGRRDLRATGSEQQDTSERQQRRGVTQHDDGPSWQGTLLIIELAGILSQGTEPGKPLP